MEYYMSIPEQKLYPRYWSNLVQHWHVSVFSCRPGDVTYRSIAQRVCEWLPRETMEWLLGPPEQADRYAQYSEH